MTARNPKRTPWFLIAIDIKHAFDAVPFRVLVKGAMNRGIDGSVLDFIRSFLEDRVFQVKVGNTRGKFKENRVEVPEGAVISPALFNIIMTDLAFELCRKCVDSASQSVQIAPRCKLLGEQSIINKQSCRKH